MERVLPFPAALPQKKPRVHILALGDVGSTLALGLRLLGGDCLSGLGLYDVRPGVAQRWAFELEQVVSPDSRVPMPPVEEISPEALFACDVFLFCASRMVPDAAVKSGDVRMAQYECNRPLAVSYGKQAKEAGFTGLFGVVSDPVDPLCAAVRRESGLEDCQVRGFGLGVMYARAAYYARRDGRCPDFTGEGRVFGPHGEGLVVANSLRRYDDALSRELTDKTLHANLELRSLGYKPYVAPALSSGAMGLLSLLRGEWHYSSFYRDGVFFGRRNRLTDRGVEVESLEALPEALRARVEASLEAQRKLQAGMIG